MQDFMKIYCQIIVLFKRGMEGECTNQAFVDFIVFPMTFSQEAILS